jgi:hypothetical protein
LEKDGGQGIFPTCILHKPQKGYQLFLLVYSQHICVL